MSTQHKINYYPPVDIYVNNIYYLLYNIIIKGM